MTAPDAPLPAPSWTDRLFGSLPVSPVWVSLLLAAALLLVYLAALVLSEDVKAFFERGGQILSERDLRLGLVLCLAAAYLPTARRYARLGASRDLDMLRPVLDAGPEGFEGLRRRFLTLDRRAVRRAGCVGLLFVPMTALLVDRDPGLYLEPGYWRPATFWSWSVGAVVAWHGAVLFRSLGTLAYRFRDLPLRRNAVDLFALEAFAPFVRQGLRATLLTTILVSLFTANVVDLGFAGPIVVLALVWAWMLAVAWWVPLGGVRAAIREAKAAELARVDGAIRGEAGALRGSLIERRADSAGLADLLAYRAFLEGVRESFFRGNAAVRLTLYAAIPLGSWLGGALVERLLSSWLD